MEQYSFNYKLSLAQEAALFVYINCIDYFSYSALIHQVYSITKRILYIAMYDGEEPFTFRRD